MASSPIVDTFLACIRSVGTAVTLASVGFYLHRRGFIEAEGKRTLALLSQQATFPLFLFTKIIYCNQNWSDAPCPDVTKSLEDVWMLLFWPIVVVFTGFFVGHIVTKLCGTPTHQYRAVLAACGFGNSTGLPITLLTVVHSNFPETSDLGHIDPTLFLSVYLLLYPVLQWGIGGWLLAPEEENDDDDDEKEQETTSLVESAKSNVVETVAPRPKYQRARSFDIRSHVLNNKEATNMYLEHRRGLSSNDEGLYMSEMDLPALLASWDTAGNTDAMPGMDDSANSATNQEEAYLRSRAISHPGYSSIPAPPPRFSELSTISETDRGRLSLALSPKVVSERKSILQSMRDVDQYNVDSLWEELKNILNRCFQPPVVGALAGIICAAIQPLRGIFVDLENRASRAPLEWLFDGLYSVGLTAVPINMMILGCNLSSSLTTYSKTKDMDAVSSALMPWSTMVGIVIGKMIVLPIIGISLGWVLKNYVWNIPDDIDGAFYLVLMIVFLTPTANNVMVMVELSGSGAKEGIAAVIALQYTIAPILLSLTLSIAVGVASGWS